MDRIIGGQGLIESGILFLRPMAGGELKQNKQEFLYQFISFAAMDHYHGLVSAIPLYGLVRRNNKPNLPEKFQLQPKKLIDSVYLEHPSITPRSP